ncbi:MAG: biotin--[acetyl-CoA-carboxylase] ligase [Fusobacteriaceae bacterium]|jgi:BirA family biotin operon repressor/biotin-[acetyl-CoA-carboxylase] ligase|nr:biotin--[acetyl-CoA-carboxylase] ligase [Fusobacteriaceae bacterium]
MDTKSQVLRCLIENGEAGVSGERIAEALGLSRTAVWQAVQKLKEAGHQIESAGNKGYRYRKTDILSPEGIRFYLPDPWKGIDIFCYDSISSTNKEAKIMAIRGAKDKTVLAANRQTEGYGRFSREFWSPPGSIYTSVILRADPVGKNTALVTIKNAVAMKRAIDMIAGVDVQIKWVNDLYLREKKIAGILTEGVMDYESGSISAVIVGTGINFAVREFPEALRDIAGSIFPKAQPEAIRNELMGAYLKEFFSILDAEDTAALIAEYKAASFVLGKTVRFVLDNKPLKGKAVDIDKEGELVVELPDGRRVSLFSGEISVKIEN